MSGFFPSVVWRFSNTFSFPLGVGMLALNRQNFYMHVVGVASGFLAYWVGI